MERRVTFDRAVWTKPLAFAADAALSYVLSIVRTAEVRAYDAVPMLRARRWVTGRARGTAVPWALTRIAGQTSGARAYERDT